MRTVRCRIKQEWIAEQLIPRLDAEVGRITSGTDIPQYLDLTWDSGVCIIDPIYPEKAVSEPVPAQTVSARFGPQLWLANDKESGRIRQIRFHWLQEYPGFAEAVAERIIDASEICTPSVPQGNALALARIVAILGLKWLDGSRSR